MESFQMIAKTFQGLEEVLAQELTALGANDIEIGRRMVSFSGDKEMMYKANFPPEQVHLLLTMILETYWEFSMD